MRNRGIENILKTLSINANIACVLLGFGEESYLCDLKQMANELNVQDRVLFKKEVPIKELWQYVGAVDVGMIPISNIPKNHYYSLPNKLFENIQSETPVICSNFPELTKIVEGYDIGLTCDSSDPKLINECIEALRTDTALYNKFKKNIKIAKKDLCWENEKLILKDAYKKIF